MAIRISDAALDSLIQRVKVDHPIDGEVIYDGWAHSSAWYSYPSSKVKAIYT